RARSGRARRRRDRGAGGNSSSAAVERPFRLQSQEPLQLVEVLMPARRLHREQANRGGWCPTVAQTFTVGITGQPARIELRKPAAPRSGSPLALVWRISTVRSVLRHGSYLRSVVKVGYPREEGFHATGRSGARDDRFRRSLRRV